MFSNIVFRQKSKLSLILFISLMLVAASFSFGANGSPLGAGIRNQEAEKLAFIAANFKAVISGAYFSPDATFVVNNNGDTVDVTPGNGICADAAGNCTLRAAIQEANASPGTDSITFALTNTPATIQLNSTISPAGLMITEAVTINGPGARFLTVSGNLQTTDGIFNFSSAVTTQASVSGMTIVKSGGHGISNEGRLTLTDVAIKTNKIGVNNSGRLTVSRVVVSGNTGTGIFLAATSTNVNISNSTITSNASATSGGGIFSLSGDVALNNVTVSHNTAEISGGGIYFSNVANGFNIRNTIIAKNTAPTGPDILAVNVNGKFVSRGNNLIGKSASGMGFTDAANNDKVGTLTAEIDPLLGALQNNGGSTDTRALLTGSPAIDAGNLCVISSSCATNPPASVLSTDQRGTDFPRIYDGNNDTTAAVDIGAFEAFYPVASIASFAPNNWGTGKGAFELIINGTNFVAGSQVKWNGQNRTTTFVSNTQLKAQILAGDTATAGQFSVTVVNPTPGGGTSDALNFPVVNCSYSINPTAQTFGASGGNNNFSVTAVNGCSWTAVTDAPWLSIATGSGTGTGNGTVAYTVAVNNGPPRNSTIIVGGNAFNISQSDGCTYSISPTSANNVSAAGLTGSLTVMPSSSACAWTATPSASWITVTNASGTSSGTINYTIAPNTGPARIGSITVNREIFHINQVSGCSFALSSTSGDFGATAGNGNLGVTAGAGCTWTAASSASWLKINSGASGSGNGAVLFTVDPNTGPLRTATITVNGLVFTVTQSSGCTYTLSSTSASNVLAAGASLSVTVTASNTGCSWTSAVAAINASWITITSATSMSGTGTVNFTITANTGLARSGTLTIANQTFTVNQLSGCTVTLTTSSSTFEAVGGTGTIEVRTNNPGCTWTATPSASWITINSGSPGTGNGTITYTVAANVSPQRDGKIIVADKEFIITQGNGCSYTVPSTSGPAIPAAGGTGSFTVSSGGGCTWTPVSNASWITITSSVNNSGSGTVNFTVAANNGPPRTGTITVNGKVYNVTQDNGCTFTLTPSSSNNVPAAGASVTVGVAASNASCTWTSTVASNSAWISISGNAGGTGDGSVQLTFAANTGPQRTGTVTIATRTFTVTQLNGCVYSLTPTGLNINENGGDRSFNINSGTGCTWSATSNDPWLTILSGAGGTGNGTITFRVAANTGAERTGTITAGGRTFTVNQLNLIVSNLNDDGLGSLRRAVANANTSPGDDVVTFQPSLAGTIFLTSGEILIENSNGSLEIKGLGADVLKISGSNISRIFYSDNSNVKITDLTLTEGNGAGKGSTETSRFGGALYANGGSLTLDRVHIFRNVINVPNSPLSRSVGGGIYLQDGTNYLIQNSTIFLNSAASGGGLFNQGELTIINSTIVANTGTKEGGAVYTVGQTNLLNSTVTGNKSQGTDKGAGVLMWGGILNIGNSIIAGNTGAEISFISGSVASGGNNLIGDAAGDAADTTSRILYQPTDILDTPPMLAVLENYGGRTFTAALLPGSPALNAGNGTNAPATDQRGAPRIVSDAIDIGAYEHTINVTPAVSSLPDGAVNASYSQKIEAQRIGSVNPTEAFRFSVIDGYLPEGFELTGGNGLLQGTPTSGGVFTFTVRAIGDGGMAGVNKYTISVGCSYTIDPINLSIPIAGGTGTINLTTSPGCTWTAVNNVPWITVGAAAASGTGNGSIPFTVAANTGAARTGTITVAGKTFTVTQAGECSYALSVPNANVPYTAGTTAFNINTGTGCTWAVTNMASWLSISGATSGSGSATITVSVAANTTTAARTGTLSIGGKTFSVTQAARPVDPTPNRSIKFDYDGDGKTDVSVFRPSTGMWHLQKSQTGYAGVSLGLATDKMVPADYDGDGKTDLAVFRESGTNATFYIINSSTNTLRTVSFGSAGDLPTAVGDWDGDGKADVAVYRAGTAGNPQGCFYYQPSTQPDVNFISYPWGSPGDKPAVADFDGDGKVDPSIFRPSTGVWFIQKSRDGFYAIQFGAAEDKLVIGDYDKDGLADQAVFRPSNGVWYIWRSSAGFAAAQFGISTDLPVPGDYDGDGQTDMAVYRDGSWFILNSTSGFAALGFGLATDIPAPNSFIP